MLTVFILKNFSLSRTVRCIFAAVVRRQETKNTYLFWHAGRQFEFFGHHKEKENYLSLISHKQFKFLPWLQILFMFPLKIGWQFKMIVKTHWPLSARRTTFLNQEANWILLQQTSSLWSTNINLPTVRCPRQAAPTGREPFSFSKQAWKWKLLKLSMTTSTRPH